MFVHPTGNANARAAIDGFVRAGLVSEFHTAIANYPGNVWARLSRTKLGKDFERRTFSESIRCFTKQRPWKELGRLIAGRLGVESLVKHETGLLSIDAVYQDLDRCVARRIRRLKPNAVYAYEDGAMNSFSMAKSCGTHCLYDLPIGYWRTARKLLSEEISRWPAWSETMPGFKDSDAKLARKDRELELADAIFVASSFTMKTLADYPGTLADIHVIPYGFPDLGAPRDYDGCRGRKLKALFVGGLSQRKGIADVFAVADNLKDSMTLTVVGQGNVEQCPALKSALARHHWIPSLPHEHVLKVMREHDVLLFPSLFEGFGLVITEAMSQGTPVITTDRTAGPDIIEHGKNGWIVPAGDTDALRMQVESLLNDPDQVVKCGQKARRTAARRSWNDYGIQLANRVKDILQDASATDIL